MNTKINQPSHSRPRLRVGARLATLVTFTFILSAALAATAAVLPRSNQRLVSQDAVPDGLSASDWSSIRQQYEQHRHAVFPVDGAPKTLQAHNPGQQWQTRFDGRGFTVIAESKLAECGVHAPPTSDGEKTVMRSEGRAPWPDASGWQWGLELRSYGFPGHERAVGFVDAHGATALTYAGLTVLDADGRALPARFEPVARGENALRLAVDEGDARYPLTIDPIAQQAYLKASNTGADDDFAYSVAVSGDTVVVGTPGEDSNANTVNGLDNNVAPDSGAAYVFVRSGTGWNQQAYLKASNTEKDDKFGWSVAISGDTVVVGAPYENGNARTVNGSDNNLAPDSGAAYVFVRSGTSWSQPAYLKAFNTAINQQFGQSVGVSGGTVVVGAPHEGEAGATNSGAAYVFVRSGTSWSQQAYLKASNTETKDFELFADGFGWSVAVSGDIVVVGAPYEDSNATDGAGNQSDNSASDSGAAYVFKRSGTSWSPPTYLKAHNSEEYDRFGYSVAVSGDMVVVGAPYEDSDERGVSGYGNNNFRGDSGAAYVFRRGTTWRLEAYLKASNPTEGDVFGYSVAGSGDTVVIGTPGEDGNANTVNGSSNNLAPNAGAAYLFERRAKWSQQAYLKASNSEEGDVFGLSVAVAGGTVVVGARREDSNATSPGNNDAKDSGGAYVFFSPGISVGIAPGDELGYVVSFTGEAEATYRLERASSVTGPWDALATLTASQAGLIEYHDTNAPVGQAFYRTASLHPPNDDFANATPIRALPAIISASNLYATEEPDELGHAGNAGGKSLWWSWTAPSHGPVTISTLGSNFDTLLAVYLGDSISQLGLVTADDDGGGNRASLVTFNAQAGATYQIAVDGFDGASGTIQLHVTLP